MHEVARAPARMGAPPLPDHASTLTLMCRNIRTLANFDPPATDAEIHASALQFVRKLSGTARPSQANEAAFARAVEEVALAAQRLIVSLESRAPARDRDEEARKARARSAARFG